MTAGFHYRFKHDLAVAMTAGFHYAGNYFFNISRIQLLKWGGGGGGGGGKLHKCRSIITCAYDKKLQTAWLECQI